MTLSDWFGVVLGSLVASCFVLLAWAGNLRVSHECDQWAQQATGVEWVCQDGMR